MNRAELAAEVERRAGGRCEYCRMHQSLQGATFHLEHIVPETRGGATDLENLAWACPGCNLQKSDRVELTDPITGELVPMFHPRREIWSDHFEWHGFELLGLTPVGRALVDCFCLNHERRQRIRHAEQLFGLYPPG